MIRIDSQIRPFDLVSSFGDLTYNEFLELQAEETTEFRQIQILTGLNEIEASFLNLDSLSPYLSFLQESPFDIERVELIEIDGDIYSLPDDIGSESWEQKINAVECLKSSDYIQLLSTYTQKQITGEPFNLEKLPEIEVKLRKLKADDFFAAVNYLRLQLIDLLETEAKMLKTEPDPKAIRAGIEMFNELGEFNTIDIIAGGDVLKYDAVLKIEYNTILNKLYRMNLTHKFDKNYQAINNTPNP